MAKDFRHLFCTWPLSSDALGIPRSKANRFWMVDRKLERFQIQNLVDQSYSESTPIFIPHWQSEIFGTWREICNELNIKYVSPMEPVEDILRAIVNSSMVFTESLHGAIFADLYRKPWIPVEINKNFCDFKWVDFFESLELVADVWKLPQSSFIDQVICSRHPNSDIKARRLNRSNLGKELMIIIRKLLILSPSVVKAKYWTRGKLKVFKNFSMNIMADVCSRKPVKHINQRYIENAANSLIQLHKLNLIFLSNIFGKIGDRV